METLNNDTRSMFGPIAIVAMAVGAMTLVGLSTYLTAKKDPQEPPFLPSSIPVIGHLISMFGEGADYYTRLYQQSHQTLYTLRILRGRLYIVSSPNWATACTYETLLNLAHPILTALDL